MTIQKQHKYLCDIYYDVEQIRNTLSQVRFKNTHIDDVFFSDIASSIEELLKDVGNSLNEQTKNGSVYEDIPDLNNHINS